MVPLPSTPLAAATAATAAAAASFFILTSRALPPRPLELPPTLAALPSAAETCRSQSDVRRFARPARTIVSRFFYLMQSLVGFRRQALPPPALHRHPFLRGSLLRLYHPSADHPAELLRTRFHLSPFSSSAPFSLFPSFFALLLFFSPLPRCNRLRLLAIRACNTISRPATASTKKRATLHSLRDLSFARSLFPTRSSSRGQQSLSRRISGQSHTRLFERRSG